MTRSEERSKAMNSYETPAAIAIGEAHDLILGQKPVLQFHLDNDFVMDRADKVDDIDETE
jgi:hypothetical protein